VEIVMTLLVLLAVGWWLLCRPVRRRLRRLPLPVYVPLNVTVKVKVTALVDGIKKCANFNAFFFVFVLRQLLRLFTTTTLQLTAYCFDSLRQLYLLVYVVIRSATVPIIFLLQQSSTLIVLILHLPLMLISFVIDFMRSCVLALVYCLTRMRRCCARAFGNDGIGGIGDIHMARAFEEARRELEHERREKEKLQLTLEVERRENQKLADALRDGAHNGAISKQKQTMDDAPPPGYYD
jgi:hypothetical protein